MDTPQISFYWDSFLMLLHEPQTTQPPQAQDVLQALRKVDAIALWDAREVLKNDTEVVRYCREIIVFFRRFQEHYEKQFSALLASSRSIAQWEHFSLVLGHLLERSYFRGKSIDDDLASHLGKVARLQFVLELLLRME